MLPDQGHRSCICRIGLERFVRVSEEHDMKRPRQPARDTYVQLLSLLRDARRTVSCLLPPASCLWRNLTHWARTCSPVASDEAATVAQRGRSSALRTHPPSLCFKLSLSADPGRVTATRNVDPPKACATLTPSAITNAARNPGCLHKAKRRIPFAPISRREIPRTSLPRLEHSDAELWSDGVMI